MAHFLAKIRAWAAAVFRFLPKLFIGTLIFVGYFVFCWGVFVSPNASFFISVLGLTLSLFNSAGLAALWIFYLSKQFSTHTVKVLDIKQSATQRKPVIKPEYDEDDEEKPLRDFAESAVGKMFNKGKERFTDNLR